MNKTNFVIIILIFGILSVFAFVFQFYDFGKNKNIENIDDTTQNNLETNINDNIENNTFYTTNNIENNSGDSQITKNYEYSIVKGDSMNPILKNGQKVLIDKNIHNGTGIQNGDIVVFKMGDRGNFVKKIYGKPGDKFEIKNDGKLYINGQKIEIKLNENCPLKKQSVFYKKIIPNNMYIVFGVNQQISEDSNEFGLIIQKQLIGKIVQ